MKRLPATLTTALMLLSASACADVTSGLTAFFSQRLAGISDDVQVTVKTPPANWPTCEMPEFSLPGNARLWGNLSVQARCDNDKRFLQVTVEANGEYVVASAPVARGSELNDANLRLQRGRLDQLPPRAMLSLDQARQAQTLRDLAPGQTITMSMVRQTWRIKAGQRVMVIASGEGFSVNSEGQALNNAAVAQNARVRMANGQVVSGTVDNDGNILITL
ncbi:flagellar basal body P-ring formation chaperone FlgA [Atlantibacter sp.]|uniref:flagellar basal body P-ring formation chaperone FlgA n=1 Tax=Atlantibacter sp. TaxID=1903473 RepID=UPI0028B1CBAA|nr:flagellar basal body P-ring formation chaperone FlgA [Atlantibacter sp.]